MSTGMDCLFIEVRPREWWYFLESRAADFDDDEESHDDGEYTAYGPFLSEAETDRHLSRNHANPGGMSISPYVEGYQPDAELQRLMDEASARRASPSPYGGRW